MSVTNNKRRKIVCVCGKTGYGKSYFVKTQIIPLPKRCIVFDINGEYENEKFIEIANLDDYADFIEEHCEDDVLRVIARLHNQEEYEYAFELADLATNCTIVIEEISNFASPHNYSETLERLIRFGRHQSTSLIAISQRIVDFGPLLLNNADLLVCFQLTDKNDINRLNTITYVGEKGSEKIEKLQKYKYIAFLNT